MTTDVGISSDEIAQYDRQIRLWGLEAQKRIRQANVLVIGVGGLGSEVVKNIVLAGVHSITLIDDRDVTEEDLSSQLLITPQCLGVNIAKASSSRTQELNPNVTVHVEEDNINDKSNEFYDQFHVVCLTRCGKELREKVNDICRDKKIKFFCGDVYGFFGYFFSDLGKHEYVVEVPVKKNEGTKNENAPSEKKAKLEEEETVTVKRSLDFCSYKEAMLEDWSKRSRKELRYSSQVFFVLIILDSFMEKYNRPPTRKDFPQLNLIKSEVLKQAGMKDSFVCDDFANYSLSTLSPVAAIVAGVLSQEIIKAISMKDSPHKNFFFFDGCNHTGVVDNIGKKAT